MSACICTWCPVPGAWDLQPAAGGYSTLADNYWFLKLINEGSSYKMCKHWDYRLTLCYQPPCSWTQKLITLIYVLYLSFSSFIRPQILSPILSSSLPRPPSLPPSPPPHPLPLPLLGSETLWNSCWTKHIWWNQVRVLPFARGNPQGSRTNGWSWRGKQKN